MDRKWIVEREQTEKVVVEAETLEQAIKISSDNAFINATTIHSKITGTPYYRHNDPAFFNCDEVVDDD